MTTTPDALPQQSNAVRRRFNFGLRCLLLISLLGMTGVSLTCSMAAMILRCTGTVEIKQEAGDIVVACNANGEKKEAFHDKPVSPAPAPAGSSIFSPEVKSSAGQVSHTLNGFAAIAATISPLLGPAGVDVAVVSGLAWFASEAASTLSADPPDTNFRTTLPIPKISVTGLKPESQRVVAILTEVAALLPILYETGNRASGAAFYGDEDSARRQMESLRPVEKRLSALFWDLGKELPQYGSGLAKRRTISLEQFADLQSAGLSEMSIGVLRKFGLSNAAIFDFSTEIKKQKPVANYRLMSGGFNDSELTRPLFQFSQALDAASTARAFGRFTMLPPAQKAPFLNVAKAGSKITLKFRVEGADGLETVERGFPVSQKFDCTTLVLDARVISGIDASALSFREKDGVFTYIWQIDNNWRNQCRLLTIKLSDGSLHYLRFQLD